MYESVLATILWFSGNFAPQGSMFCNGATLQIAQNQALYSLIGTYYGGDGRSTFKLPDLRPDVIEYRVTGTPDAPKVTPVVTGKREWRSDEPKCLIITQGYYPSRP